MKLGVMQPYFFPYIGYFQLINAVDRFVIYDDVAFIRQGWINRNNILLNGAPHMFTVPLKNASSFVAIRGTEINTALYDGWKTKFLKTIAQAYSKAPHYPVVNDLLQSVLEGGSVTIGGLAAQSIAETLKYLGVGTELVMTSSHYGNNELKAQDRIIDICKREGASAYINASGGKELYAKTDFESSGLLLNFIRPGNIIYPQFGNEFVPWLSMIDVMMFNAPDTIRGLLNEYTLE